MMAANVYDQVRGTLRTGMQKKNTPEPIPAMADLLKEIQQGTEEAGAWATKAMINHYPDQSVALYREREQQERDNRRNKLSRTRDATPPPLAIPPP